MTLGMQTGSHEMSDDARRVATELHDGAMQEITLARLQIDLLSAGVGDDPALAEQFAQVSEALGDASVRLQALMRSLAPRRPEIVQTSR